MIKLDDKGLVPAIVQDAGTGPGADSCLHERGVAGKDAGLGAGVVL